MRTLDRTTPPGPGALRPFHLPEVHRDTLPNGLTVITARRGRMPIVTAALIVEGGAASEPAHLAGVAHLTARALDAGTARRSGDQLALDLEYLGIEFQATANWDAALLSLTVPRERLEQALELFAEIAREPSFPETEVERLRDQQLAGILQRRTEPRSLAGEAAARFIFAPEVPYSRPLDGFAESVQALTHERIREFYGDRYRPDPAALILVGDIDHDAALALAESRFGAWSAVAGPVPDFEVTQGYRGTTIFLVDRPGSVQSELRMGHVGVERTHPDYHALSIMNTILGGAFTSRLNMTLRERLGFTYGVSSRFAYRRRPGPFVIQTAVATDVTARTVEETLRQIRELQDGGPTSEELDAAKDYLAGILPLQFQTTEQVAGRLADLFVYRLPDDYLSRYRERIAAVTADDVLRVARTYVRPDDMAVVVVGDAKEVEGPLQELGIGPVRKYGTDLVACT